MDNTLGDTTNKDIIVIIYATFQKAECHVVCPTCGSHNFHSLSTGHRVCDQWVMRGKKHIKRNDIDCPGYIIQVDPSAVDYRAITPYRAALRTMGIPNSINGH
jgi:hypothetical protein